MTATATHCNGKASKSLDDLPSPHDDRLEGAVNGALLKEPQLRESKYWEIVIDKIVAAMEAQS